MSLQFAARRSAGVLLISSLSLVGQEWTEQTVIQEFLAGSPVVRETTARTEALRAEAQGRLLYSNPQAAVSHEGAGLTQFFEVGQSLPITGRRRFVEQAGQAAIAASDGDAAARLWNLRTDLRRAFYELLAAQEHELALSGGVADLDETIRILRKREEEGEGARFDRLRAERERFELESQLASARAAVAWARSQVATHLRPQIAIGRVTGTLALDGMIPASSELEALAMGSRADYRSEQQQVKRYQAEQKAADRLRYPEPIVAVGLKRADVPMQVGNRLSSGIEYGPSASVTVPIPLFNKGKTEVVRFRAEEAQAGARLETLERRIRAQVNGARETLLLRIAALDTYRGQVMETGAELSRIARAAYQEGELGILELLDSYRINLQARTRLLDLELAVKEAGIDLDQAVGVEVAR